MTEAYYKPGESVALAAKHGKEQAISRPFSRKLGLRIVVPDEIDTDVFGTFTREIERDRSALETAFAKARLGMKITGLSLGTTSEGSFGAHPSLPCAVADSKLLVFVDDRHGFQVAEQSLTTQTNFASIEISSCEEMEKYLSRVKFPSHALVARPNRY